MNTTTEIPMARDQAQTNLEEIIQRLLSGQRDIDGARRVCAEMDRRREEIRQQVGTVDLAVDLIREIREEEP